jgi:hypothetical protein
MAQARVEWQALVNLHVLLAEMQLHSILRRGLCIGSNGTG